MFTNCNSCGALVDLDDHIKCPNCGAPLENKDVEKHKELEYRKRLADVKQRELEVLHSAERLKEKQAANNRQSNYSRQYNNYQQPKQTYKKKKGGFAKTMAMLIVLVTIFVIMFTYLGVLGIKEEYGSMDKFMDEFQSEMNDVKPELKEDVKVYVGFNEPAQTLKYSVTCDSYEEWIYPADDYWADYRQPSAGHRYVRFHFVIENTSDDTIYVNKEYVVSADGFQCEKASLTDEAADSQIKRVDLAPGLKTAGYIYRKVPIDAKEVTLQYGEWVNITFPLEIE